MSNIEKPLTVAEATHRLQSRLDELMAPHHFQELLEMAENVCLDQTPNYPGEFETIGEATIISQLGTRGIKAALELEGGFIIMGDDNPENYEDEGDRPITLDTPFRLTGYFSDKIDFSILAKAEAFGAQLMAESLRILGHDADQKIIEFRQATTKQEQLNVIRWLDERLYKITHTDTQYETINNEGEDEFLYHPARLSPKLIGTYPNNNLTPTCLGVSIIASGFFKKAGADVLHADVARRGIEQDQANTYHFINQLRQELGPKFGLSVPQAVQTTLDRAAKQQMEAVTRNDAHHSAVYVRLMDDSWVQFDSNFLSTVPIREPNAHRGLTNSYNTLTAHSAHAPGTEISGYLDDYLSPIQLIEAIFEHLDPIEITHLMASAIEEFDNTNPESFGQRIYDACIEPFFRTDSVDERLNHINMVFKSEIDYSNEESPEPYIQRAFYAMFEKYVLWGKSPEEVIAQMHKDKNYLMNRVMDIATLPFIIMASVATTASMDPGYYRSHSFVELGLPEQRIGLATLSDFAAYTESPLSASFWMSHWPGSVSVMENIGGASRSDIEDSSVYNNVVHRAVHPLTPKRNYNIIESFVTSRQPIGKENNDGKKDR